MALVRSAHPEASSSSSNASSSTYRYDVFLSFRGEDTRKAFTDHLYAAFINAGVRTFRDDNELERGESIKPELEKAIKQSRSSVVVFSKDYASSAWCLDGLLMIMERKRTADHKVLPVFYHVDPSHVRKQTGSLAKAFARHERNQSLKDKVKRWRAALTEAADLAGMVLADGHESEFIKKVVKVIEDKLRGTPLGVDEHLIGIHSQVEEINLWLEDGSTDVCILLICGMRGIGKSTIAKVVYNQNFRRFERCSFLEGVREVSKQPNGLVSLQNQLLNDILTRKEVKIQCVSEGIAKIEEAVSSRRVFLVLDDVDHVDHLDALLRMQSLFHQGSKVIITTSCAGLVEAHREFVKVHEVKTLGYSQSLELFSWHAFRQNHPIESYMDLSKRIVNPCGGIPLALKVLGSSLSGKTVDLWESELNKLEVIPNAEILKKLKLSYDSLQDDHDRHLFLDIACFFIGMQKDVIVTILDDWDFFPEVGIQNLIDRCLVTIESNMVQMHNMIRDMGRDIVRLESKEPRKRSRIWHHMDSVKVLTENNGTEAIEGIVANMQLHPTYTSSRNSSKVVLEANAFTRMRNLRFLQLSHVQLSGCFEGFPTGLRWLCWSKYPLACLPDDFPLESIVVLDMCYSSLRRVWKGTKYLPSLKILDFSHSHDLTETPDFSSVPNLERLTLRDCVRLIDVHESIGSLGKLVYLNVQDCISIRRLPKNICLLVSLEVLIISGCSSLDEFPVDMRKMKSLKEFQADGVPVHRLRVTTTRRWNDWNLSKYLWSNCTSPIPEISWASYLLRNLVNLSLKKYNLMDDDFPKDVAILLSLEKLDLSGNLISRLPDCIRAVTGLRDINFSDCTKLKSLERLPGPSVSVSGTWCTSLEKITYQSSDGSGSDESITSNYNLVEWQGDFKLEPIETVDKEMLKLLSLSNLESLENIWMERNQRENSKWRGMRPVQGLYENGIFSTFLPGEEVRGQYSYRSRGSCVSFTMPLLPNLDIRGLNIFSVLAQSNNHDSLPPITNVVNIPDDDAIDDDVNYGWENTTITVVINKSKGLKWIYAPWIYGVPREGKEVTWLSHWRLGNGVECGDEVTILIYTRSKFMVKECGVQAVFYDQNTTPLTDLHPCFLQAGVKSTIPFYPEEEGTIWCCNKDGIPGDVMRDINKKSGLSPSVQSYFSYLHESLKESSKEVQMYFSLFPSTYEFRKDELVQMWMAEGFIEESQTVRMEDIGITYFNDLHKRGILVLSRCDSRVDFDSVISVPTYNPGKLLYKVNPVKFSELVKKTACVEYLAAVDGTLDGASEVTRHLSLNCEEISEMTFGVLKNFKHLRTLILLSGHQSSIKHVPRDLFLSLKDLRTLNLSGTLISEVPSSIRNAKSLRYLDLSNTRIRQLPESIDSLHHLQTMKLRGCRHFLQLPKGMKKLINLQHIDLDITRQLRVMPPYLGNLTNLQTLSAFLVGREEGCRIGELKNLNNLGGVLRISRLENVSDKEEAEEAVLVDKKYLQRLELRWSTVVTEKIEEQEKILECLQPHAGLKELQIQHYAGSRLPTWISNPSFTELLVLTLYRCTNCQLLPSIGQLRMLKSLSIIEMNGVKEINHQFFRDGLVVDQAFHAFPKLEILEVDIMFNLKEWSEIIVGDFPSLLKLTMDSCPELDCLPSLSWLKSLEHLEFRRCPKLLSLPSDGLPTSLKSFIVIDCPELTEWCRKVEGEDWSKIYHVPRIWFDCEEVISMSYFMPGTSAEISENMELDG